MVQHPRDAFEGSKVRLKKGMYAIMPSDKMSAFAKERDKLKVESAARDAIRYDGLRHHETTLTFLIVSLSESGISPSRLH